MFIFSDGTQDPGPKCGMPESTKKKHEAEEEETAEETEESTSKKGNRSLEMAEISQEQTKIVSRKKQK
jgi:hypothetical protein